MMLMDPGLLVGCRGMWLANNGAANGPSGPNMQDAPILSTSGLRKFNGGVLKHTSNAPPPPTPPFTLVRSRFPGQLNEIEINCNATADLRRIRVPIWCAAHGNAARELI